MSEAKEYRIRNLSVDKNGWMHVVLSRSDDIVANDAYIKLVEYSALAAKDAEIEQLKKRNSWLESGLIHTCHAECEKPLCVADREIERLKRECSSMGKLLQSGVVISYEEHDEFMKIKSLKSELKDKDVVLEWYADRNNWKPFEYQLDCKDMIDISDLGVKSYSDKADYALPSGGRRSREVINKYKK